MVFSCPYGFLGEYDGEFEGVSCPSCMAFIQQEERPGPNIPGYQAEACKRGRLFTCAHKRVV